MKAHLPRHEPMEALRSLIAAPPEEKAKSYLEYVGAFSSTANTEKTRPANLLDLYATDIREIYLDTQRRPDHYDERQREIVESLMMSTPLKNVTDQEKNDILVTFMQRTVGKEERERKAQEEDRRRKKREQEENDEIVLEDGRTLSESVAAEKAQQQYEGIFERQDFGDKIIV